VNITAPPTKSNTALVAVRCARACQWLPRVEPRLDVPDLCSNVRGAGAQQFAVSVALVAATQALGFVWAAMCAWHLRLSATAAVVFRP
jgi:hypothetical protein